jgi:hypothetical protein
MLRNKLKRGNFIMHGGKIILKKDRHRDDSEEYERLEKAEAKKFNDMQVAELKAISEKKKSGEQLSAIRGRGVQMQPLKFKY